MRLVRWWCRRTVTAAPTRALDTSQLTAPRTCCEPRLSNDAVLSTKDMLSYVNVWAVCGWRSSFWCGFGGRVCCCSVCGACVCAVWLCVRVCLCMLCHIESFTGPGLMSWPSVDEVICSIFMTVALSFVQFLAILCFQSLHGCYKIER